MVDVVQVNASGGVPPLPQGGSEGRGAGAPPLPAFPQPAAPTPAPVAPAGTFTEADVQARIAAALANQSASQGQAPALPNPTSAIPPSYNFQNDVQGDPVLTSMTEVFTAAARGIDIDRAIGKALANGDASLIDMHYINEKAGADASRIATLAKGIVDRVQSQAQAVAQSVFTTAGGEANWNAAAAAFNTSAPAHYKQVVATMLNSKDISQVQAAAQMVIEHARGAGLVPTQGQYVQGAPGAAVDSAPLDKAGFQAALQKLDRNARDYEAQRGALFARRQAGKNRGMN